MKPEGKAAFILGGHTHYNAQGLIAGRNRGNHAVGDRFFNYLHHYYNVVDVISIDGELYARQGTQFDVRVVLVDGVKKEPSGFAQWQKKSIKLWSILSKRFMKDL
jgi:hypothetical protein